MEHSSKTLIVNYLPNDLTENSLLSIFSTIGLVDNCKVMTFKSGYSRGYGFVTYADPKNSLKAIEQLNGLEIGSKRIKVSLARPRSQNPRQTNLYITNLPRHFTEDDLDKMFGKFGHIVLKTILHDKTTGLPRGVAFVKFSEYDEAQEAIKHVHGLVLEGENDPIGVKVAEDHSMARLSYRSGFQAGFLKRKNHFHPYTQNRQFNHVNMVPFNSSRPQMIGPLPEANMGHPPVHNSQKVQYLTRRPPGRKYFDFKNCVNNELNQKDNTPYLGNVFRFPL